MDLSVERAWMYKPYCNGILSEEFVHGVETFIKLACSHPTYMDGEKIKCPCSKCKIRPFRPPDTVRLHLETNGFLPRYDNWYFHRGEPLMPKEQDSVAYRDFVASVKKMRMNYTHEAESEQSVRKSHCVELLAQDLENVPRTNEEHEIDEVYKHVNKIDKKTQMYAASRSSSPSIPTSQLDFLSSDPVILKFQSDLQERKDNQLEMDSQIKEMKRMLEQMKEHVCRRTGLTPDQLRLTPP